MKYMINSWPHKLTMWARASLFEIFYLLALGIDDKPDPLELGEFFQALAKNTKIESFYFDNGASMLSLNSCKYVIMLCRCSRALF